MRFAGALLLLLVHQDIGARVVHRREKSDGASQFAQVVHRRDSANSSRACVELLIIGDFGDEDSIQSDVRDAMAEVAEDVDPDAILALGDNVYPDGVADEDDMKDAWRDIWLKRSALKRKWYGTLGNHDWYESGSAMKNYDDGYWTMPDYSYSVKFDNDIEVFMVDTELWRGGARRRAPSSSGPKEFLESQLEKSSATWRIVAGHHPVYSAGSHGGSGDMQNELDPIMRKNRGNIYLSGHDHSQQHIFYSNVNYVVSGAGSKKPRSRSDDYPSGSLEKYQGEPGFAGLSICNSNTATLKLYDSSGRAKYTATISNDDPNGGGGGSPSRRRGGGDGDDPPRRRSSGRRRSSRRRSSRRRDDSRRRRRRRGAMSASAGGETAEEDEEAEAHEPENLYRDQATCKGERMSQVDQRCSDDGCTIQTDLDRSKSCDDYCAENGLSCIGSWHNDYEDCGLDRPMTCQTLRTGMVSQVCRCE